MKYRAFILLALLVPVVCSCEGFEFIPSPENSVTRDDNGKKDVFENAEIPEFHITVPLDQWNTLLAKYDENGKTKAYVSCDVVYIDEKDHLEIKDAGLRLRGNTSRRRPEGWWFGRDKFLVEKSGNKSVTFLIFVYYNRWKRLDV